LEEWNSPGKTRWTIGDREGLFGYGGVDLEFDCAFAKAMEVVFGGKSEDERCDRLGLRRKRNRLRRTEAEGRSSRSCLGGD
jgi:hypothetical protein